MQRVAETFQAAFDAVLELPERLRLTFEPDRCLSSKDIGSVWLLRRRADSALFLLRIAPEDALWEEFRLLDCVSQVLPGVVPFPLDCFSQDGKGYFLRSYLPGQTLAQWRDARGGCSDAKCAEIGRQICALLEKLHGMNPPVIHRDIKPENLIMGPDGCLRLIDFGIARQYRAGADRDTKNLGTEGTAAPEQYGFAQTDARTDLYGLGMTLLWLRTGSYERTALRQAAPPLRRVLARATDFSPDRRFASAAEFRRALTGRSSWKPWLALGLTAAVLAPALLSTFLWRTAETLRLQLAEAHTRLEAMEAAQWEAAQAEAAQAEIVTFYSRCLEAAVRAELEQPEGVVTYQDLTCVTRLAVAGQETISQEQDFQYPVSAAADGAPAGDISDLSLLADMPNLRTLYLCDQRITDLTPLAELPLEVLYLGGNPLGDLAPLQGLSRLRELNLDNTNPASLAPLAELPVQTLSLNMVHVRDEDWSVLEEMDQVMTLQIRNAPTEALAYLPQMDALLELCLEGYPGADLTLLKLPRLEVLQMIGGSLTDLTGIEQLEQLGTLNLTNCNVTDLSPLSAAPRLFSLCLNCPDLDYAQLNSLPNLQYVRVPAEDHPTIETLCPGHRFELLPY